MNEIFKESEVLGFACIIAHKNILNYNEILLLKYNKLLYILLEEPQV